MVRGVIPPGSVAPAVPVPPVTPVESGPVIGQEFALAAAAEGGQGRFRNDSITFQEPEVRPDAGGGAGDQVAEEPPQGTQDTIRAELQLGDVTVFVDGQGGDPRHRFGGIGIGQRIEVHPHRGPGNAAVGFSAEGVKDHRHRPFVQAAGQVADAAADLRPEFLQGTGINPGQGVQPARVDQFVMVGPEG